MSSNGESLTIRLPLKRVVDSAIRHAFSEREVQRAARDALMPTLAGHLKTNEHEREAARVALKRWERDD